MGPQRTAVEPLTLDDAEALLEGAGASTRRSGHRVAEDHLAFPEALPAIVEALAAARTPPGPAT